MRETSYGFLGFMILCGFALIGALVLKPTLMTWEAYGTILSWDEPWETLGRSWLFILGIGWYCVVIAGTLQTKGFDPIKVCAIIYCFACANYILLVAAKQFDAGQYFEIRLFIENTIFPVLLFAMMGISIIQLARSLHQ